MTVCAVHPGRGAPLSSNVSHLSAPKALSNGEEADAGPRTIPDHGAEI